MGALNEQAALPCSRDKDVAHSLPDGRGRKEGGVALREHVPVAREGSLLEREGGSGPGESNSISHGPTPWLWSHLHAHLHVSVPG